MKTFTLHNRGTITSFNPDSRMAGGKAIYLFMDFVASAGRPDVFLMDNKGREVVCTPFTPVELRKAA